jgi:hypothetical protein
MDLIKNKRIGRACDYERKDEGVITCYEFEAPDWKLVGTRTREEAHEWLHGYDLPPKRKSDSRESKLADMLVTSWVPVPRGTRNASLRHAWR